MPVDLIDDDSTFPAVVQPPAGSDIRVAASVLTAFQQLADRTAYLKKLAEPGDVRSIILSPEQATYDPTEWTPVGLEPGSLTCDQSVSKISWDLNRLLPSGAIIQQIDALVTMGANVAEASRMEISIENRVPDFTALSLDAGTPDGPIFVYAGAASAGAIELFSLTTAHGSIPFTLLSTAVTRLAIRSRADTNPLSPVDEVHAVRISFTDPGPRSY